MVHIYTCTHYIFQHGSSVEGATLASSGYNNARGGWCNSDRVYQSFASCVVCKYTHILMDVLLCKYTHILMDVPLSLYICSDVYVQNIHVHVYETWYMYMSTRI